MDKDSKIFVTGASGLVGSHLTRKLLDEGFFNITCAKRSESNLDSIHDVADQVKWVVVDLLEADLIYDVIADQEYIFHCAAMVTFDPGLRQSMYKINVEGTANIVNACIQGSVKRLIYVSSVAAIGRDPKVEIIDEDTQWTESLLNSDYGKSKMLGELEVWRGFAEGLEVVVANPSLILGKGDWSKSSLQIFNRIRKGIRYYPSGGNGVVDARDVANALMMLAMTERVNERYIISAENILYKDFFGMIAKAMGVNRPTKSMPDWMTSIAPVLEKMRSLILFRPPILTRASLRSLNHVSRYENKKSRDVIGINYRPLEDTINTSATAYLSDL